jgi:ligand-binding SRPBCC domain-containing protein
MKILVKAASGIVSRAISLAFGKKRGRVYTLQKSQWIARPPDDVFPFFANAANLERLTPPWLRFEILNPGVDLHRGAIIDYRLRVHGIPLRWQSEILEWEPPHRFVDVQRKGPYSLWIHEHRFEPRDGGTVVYDNVQYAAPGGALVQRFLIAHDLDRIFSYRRARLEEHFV